MTENGIQRNLFASWCLPTSSAPTASWRSTRSIGSPANTASSPFGARTGCIPKRRPKALPDARSPERTERLRAWIKDMAPEQYDRGSAFPEKRQYSFLAFEALEFAYDRDATSRSRRRFTISCGPKDAISARPRPCWPPPNGQDSTRPSWRMRWTNASMPNARSNAVNQARDIGITNTPTIFLGKNAHQRLDTTTKCFSR